LDPEKEDRVAWGQNPVIPFLISPIFTPVWPNSLTLE